MNFNVDFYNFYNNNNNYYYFLGFSKHDPTVGIMNICFMSFFNT